MSPLYEYEFVRHTHSAHMHTRARTNTQIIHFIIKLAEVHIIDKTLCTPKLRCVTRFALWKGKLFYTNWVRAPYIALMFCPVGTNTIRTIMCVLECVCLVCSNLVSSTFCCCCCCFCCCWSRLNGNIYINNIVEAMIS